jgi:hypothetical protein
MHRKPGRRTKQRHGREDTPGTDGVGWIYFRGNDGGRFGAAGCWISSLRQPAPPSATSPASEGGHACRIHRTHPPPLAGEVAAKRSEGDCAERVQA